MASRVVGALLALMAAALLVVAIVATPWWSGHPTFNGAVIHAKEITISPLGARGCNTGGDGACMSIPADATFETIGMVTTGAAGLLALACLALGVLAMIDHPRRKSFAVFAIVGAIVAGGLAVILVMIGPQIRTDAPLPLATGLFVFFGGVAAALATSVVSMRAREAPRRKSMPARSTPMPIAPSPGALDVKALLQEDGLRPTSLGPEPMLGRGSPVHSPGGALPGPSGPLGAVAGTGPQQPLFTSAPQLRPLYEMPGNRGLRPSPPMIPLRPPTPIPRDQISAIAGIPTPASLDIQRPVTINANSAPPPPIPATPPPLPPPATPSPETDRDLLGARRGGASQFPKPKTLPPPTRPNRPSVPMPARPIPKPPSTLATAAVPPPPNLTMPATPSIDDDEPFDAMKTYQREKEPPPRPSTPRPPTRLLMEDVSNEGPEWGRTIDTDVAGQAIDEGEAPVETFESPTHESPAFAAKARAPSRQGTRPSSTMETQAAPDDEPAAPNREASARTDLDLPTTRPPTETSTSIEAPPEPPKPEPVVAPEPPKAAEPPKLPISTADKSLPPPSEKQQATSGPSPACPQCEAPMAWVEAHLRFYCKSCKMYF
jgi:hypothetical protein